jgi:hypothetical protein
VEDLFLPGSSGGVHGLEGGINSVYPHTENICFQFYKYLFGERRNNQEFISEEKPDYVTENVKKLQEEVRRTKIQ